MLGMTFVSADEMASWRRRVSALHAHRHLRTCFSQVLRGLKGAVVRMQKPVGNFIRAVLLMPLYVPLFAPKAYSSATASHVYMIVLKVQALCQHLVRCGLAGDTGT